MKLTTLALVSLAALATAANGASLQIDNITSGFDGNDLALLDNAGDGLVLSLIHISEPTRPY